MSAESDRALRDEIEQLDAELRRLSVPSPSLQPEIDALSAQCAELERRREALTTDEQEARTAKAKLIEELTAVRAKIARIGARHPVRRAIAFLDDLIPEPREVEPPPGCAGVLFLLTLAGAVWGTW